MGFILGVQGLSSGFYKLAGVFLLVAVIFGLVLSDNIPYVSAQGTAGHADGAADGSSGAGTSADGGGFTNDFGTVNINGQDYNVTQNDQTQGPSISPVSPGTDFGGGGSDDGGGDIYTSPILPCSITAEQAQLRAGQSTNLNWPRSQFEGTFRDGTFEGEVFYDFPGYHVVTPTETTTYDLYVHTYQGEREGGTDYYYECSVTVEVVPPPTCTITPADLHVAASGGDATVSWTIADAGDSTLHIISPSTGDNEEAYLGPNNGSHTVAINEPTVFRLDVWEGYPDGTWGNGSCETTIEPVPSPSCSININSGNLSGGGYVTAAWSIQNAGDSTLHVVSPGRGDEEFPYLGPSNGSQVVGVSENTDFHLDVWNAYGDTYRCSASVNVPQPRCDFLNASDRLLPYGGGQIDLNWGTTDASGAVISFSRCDNNGCVTSFTSNEDGSYNNQTVTETTLFTLQVGDVTAPVNKSVSQCIEIVNVTAPQCSDNQDNDGDGSTDTADLNCADCATRDVIEYSASQWYANPTWNSGGSVSSARADGYCVIQGHDGALSSTARNAAGENIRACWTSANSNNCAQCDESPWNGSGCNVIQTVQCYDETIVTQCLDDTEEADLNLRAENTSPSDGASYDEGEEIRLQGFMRNTGPDTLDVPVYAEILIDYYSDGLGILSQNAKGVNQYIIGLASGDVESLLVTLNNAPAGTHRYQIFVDSTNVITNEVETDNRTAWRSFTVVAPSIDLEAFNNAPAVNTSFDLGVNIPFTGSMRNNGPNAHTETINVHLEIDTTGNGSMNYDYRVTGNSITTNLNSGSSLPLEYGVNSLSPGIYHYRFNVDRAAIVAEDPNRANNTSPWIRFVVNAPDATGSISGTDCLIALNASTCDGTVSWNVTDPGSGTVRVYNTTTGQTVVSGVVTRNNHATTLQYGANVFQVQLDGSPLANTQLDASCTPGTVWLNSVCSTPPPTGIDLEGISVSPANNATFDEDEPITFTGTALSNGPDTVTDNFYADLEIDRNGDGIVASGDNHNAKSGGGLVTQNLVLGDSVPLSYTLSNLQPGVYRYRFNVDTDDRVQGEEDETNNVSAWRTFTISSLPVPTVELSVSLDGGAQDYSGPININDGQSAQVYWESENAVSCTVTQGASAGFVISPATLVDSFDDTITEPTPGNSVTFGVSCVNSAGVTASDTIVLSTNMPTGIDLEAQNNTPVANTSFVQGTNIVFTGTMLNNGPEAHTQDIYTDLEIDPPGSGSNYTYSVGGGIMTTNLANGESRGLTYGVDDLAPGTYYYRFVVDTEEYVIKDVDKINNLAPWIRFVVTPAPAPSAQLSISINGGVPDYSGPVTMDEGQYARVYWESENAVSCTVTQGAAAGFVISPSSNVNYNDSTITEPTSGNSVTFGVSCVNSAGVAATDTIVLSTNAVAVPSPSVALSVALNGGDRNYASSVTMDEGQAARIYWESSNASTCTVTQGAAAGFVISPATVTTYSDPTITEPTPGNSVTFGVSCVNSTGVAATDTLVLSTNVPAAFDLQAFSTAPANNGSFSTGESINFTGSFRSNGPGAVTPSFYADLEIDRNGDGIVASGDNHNAKSGGGYFTQNYNAGDTQTLGYSLYGLPAGSYRYRFNVDTNDQVPGESNETNNVSAWRSFTVTAAPTPSGTITGSSCTIAIGASTCEGSLTWNVSNPGSGTPNVRNLTNNSSVDSGNATRTNHSTNLTYGNSDFSVRVNTTDLNTVRLTTSCALGGTWNGAMCAANVSIGPSGTISGTGCVIADGEKTCVGELTWNVTESSGNTNVYDVSNTATVSTGDDNENNFSVPLTEGTHSFRLRDNTTVLNSVDLIAQCSATATWNGSICEVNTGGGGGGTPTVDADLSAIRDGDEVTITWDPALNLNCVMTSSANFPVGTIFTTPGSYTFNAPGNQSLSRTTEFVYKCDGVPAVTEKVFVLPTIFET